MSSTDLSSTMEPDAATGAARTIQLPARYIRFGPFQIDQQRQEVSKSGSRLRLQGKVYQVLLALVEKQGDVLTREELRLRLWPNETHVNYDANVNTTVNKLRQALGDSCEKPVYIETVPRKGYCLLVQPDFTEFPAPPGPATTDSKDEALESISEPDASRKKTDLWITIGVIALIVAGMLLGAGITRLWIGHFDQQPIIAPWP
ncbi:MAG TPA: winged helix-turn-helix domain-containing protein [Candidatus Acidoferrum sp.]